MFLNYEDVKNFVIDELINQNTLTTSIFLQKLTKRNLLDFVLDNIALKENVKTKNLEIYVSDYFIGSIVKNANIPILSDKRRKFYILMELLNCDLNSKLNLSYALLDYNGDQLIKDGVAVHKIIIKLNFKDIVEQKLILKDGIYFNDSKCLIKYNLFYDNQLIGIYENYEKFLLPRYANDFMVCAKIINQEKSVDKSKLNSLRILLKENNKVYKQALENPICKSRKKQKSKIIT